jgi:hypothetical protein
MMTIEDRNGDEEQGVLNPDTANLDQENKMREKIEAQMKLAGKLKGGASWFYWMVWWWGLCPKRGIWRMSPDSSVLD